MTDEDDEFLLEPQYEVMHQIAITQQQQQISTLNKQKIANVKPEQNFTLRLPEPKKQQRYTYKSFALKKQDSFQSQNQSDEEQNKKEFYVNGILQSTFLRHYNLSEEAYIKYNNSVVNTLKQQSYFSGCFIHKSILMDNQNAEIYSIVNLIKQYYDLEPSIQSQLSPKKLQFDSNFESGNLFAAFKISMFQYDLIMQNDINSTGNNQWFFFSVLGMIPGRQYTFNIINFTKNDSLFNYGMAPVIYSQIECAGNPESKWCRIGKQISYKRSRIRREQSKRYYYRLSFKVSSNISQDKIYISHSYPYTYTKLKSYLQDKASKFKDLVTCIKIGKTGSKKIIEALMITQAINKKRDNRKAVIIMARQHPGQTQGSFVCEGCIDRLLSRSKQGQFLRKNYVFYIIPMVNPDGVIFGHYRCNIFGKDLNRKWDSSEKQIMCPQVLAIKSFLQQVSRQRDIRFILDLHGHSKKLNSFFYGNPCVENPDVVRIFPYICSKLHPGILFYDCTFATEEYKRKAARVFLSFYHRQLHVYTFQSSFYAYYKEGQKIQFTPKQYRNLGHTLINALQIQLEHEIKYQQSFAFNLSKCTNSNSKQFNSSPFVKMLTELKNNKTLIEVGNINCSGSQSKPEQTQINYTQITNIEVNIRPKTSRSETQSNNKISGKPARKLPYENKDYTMNLHNKQMRNIKYLEISRVNAILPDKYQLGLQPIRKKDKSQSLQRQQSIMMKNHIDTQTTYFDEIIHKQFTVHDIENCANLSGSLKYQPQNNNLQERRYSSIIKTQNRNNIIFKIDIKNQNLRKEKLQNIKKSSYSGKHKYGFSQTLISFRKNPNNSSSSNSSSISHNNKINSHLQQHSHLLPQVQTTEIGKKNDSNSHHLGSHTTMKIGLKRQNDFMLNGIVKRYFHQKQHQNQALSVISKCIDKPLNIKRKDLYRK